MPVRKLLSVVVGAGLLLSLSACAAGPTGFAGCDEPGTNSALVTAAGAAGSDPKATFPTPIVVKKADLAVLSTGDGDQISSADGADIVISLYDGTTGEALTGQNSAPLVSLKQRVFIDGAIPFTTALECATVGSRVVTTGTVQQLLGGDSNTDPLIIVTDITGSFLGQANGADQVPQAGFPAVVFTPRGQPGFTFPDGDAPATLTYGALKQGNGDEVAKGDNVIVNLAAIAWDGAQTFASTWDNNAPAVLVASSLPDDPQGLAPGLAEALIGQQVGSRLIVVVPPADGYPQGTAPSGVDPTSTLVFVVDILGIG